MRSVVQQAYGSDPGAVLSITDVPTPVVGPKQVLVHVAAASVDRGTWHLMAGRPQLMRLMGYGLRRPKARNPGRAFAGTVVSVGADVDALGVGDEVYGTCEASYAQYVAADVEKVARKPGNLTFEQAAGVPVSAVAALQAVRDQAKVQPGQRVLIVGASGGVGTFLVQLVKAFDGHVTAVASTAKLDLVRELGADDVVDYTKDDFTDGRRTYDVILDVGGNRPLGQVRRALAPDGTLVIVGGETDGKWLGGFARNLRLLAVAPFIRGQHLRSLVSKENGADLDALRALIEQGKLRVVTQRSFPLDQAAAAIRHLVDGHARGKLVITV